MFFDVLAIFVLVTVVCYIIIYFLKHLRLSKQFSKIPGQYLPTIASFRLFLLSKPKTVVKNFEEILNNDLKLTKTWFFGYTVILTKDPNFVNKILNFPQTYDKVDDLNKKAFLQNGLINLNGDDHKRHRKILNKAFTTRMLQFLPEIFDLNSKKILTELEKNVGCGEFDVVDFIGAYALDAFSQSNLNYDFYYFNSDIFGVYRRSLIIYSKIFPYLIIGIGRRLIRWTKIGREIEKCFKIMKNFKDSVVIKNRTNSKFDDHSVMTLLMSPQNGFTDAEVFDEMFLIALAAYDTSSKVISTVLMMLGIHQNVQEKVHEEVCSMTEHSKVSMDCLNNFRYLDAVIKETMRLFTVVPLIMRQASEDVDIDGILIPKDTVLIMSLDAMHKDAKFWGNDSKEFIPERFLKDLEYPHAYAPFADGRRICLGYRYAMISMKVFLINFVRKFHINCSAKVENLKTEMMFTQSFVDGYKISILKR